MNNALFKTMLDKLMITLAVGVLYLGVAGPVEAAKPSELKLAVVYFISGAGAPHDEAAWSQLR